MMSKVNPDTSSRKSDWTPLAEDAVQFLQLSGCTAQLEDCRVAGVTCILEFCLPTIELMLPTENSSNWEVERIDGMQEMGILLV